MKRLLSLVCISYTLLFWGVSYAQINQYGEDFVGPIQQDSLALQRLKEAAERAATKTYVMKDIVAGKDFSKKTDGIDISKGPFAQIAQTTTQCGPQENGDYILCQAVGNLISQRQTDFVSFLRELYMLAFILAGTIAFIRIVYGGILYSISGVINKKKEAIGIFKNVAIGMGLLMSSYIILNTINPALTVFSLPSTIQKQGQGISTFISDGVYYGTVPPLHEMIDMPNLLDKLDTSIDTIRQENTNIINNLGLYTPAPDDTETINLINDQINAIGTPQNKAEQERLTELQNALNEYQNTKTQINAEVDAVTNTRPQQFKRSKTTP